MSEERRAAPRFGVPDDVVVEISGLPARLLDLSLVGGKVEHRERFALAAPQLKLSWRGTTMTLPVRAARSEIVGRDKAQLIYRTGFYFVNLDPGAEGLIASILRRPEAVPLKEKPRQQAVQPSGDDTWTRQIVLMRHEAEDEQLPYAQFRLTPTGWEKEYVATPAQPEDGFTIARERRDFDELQRTFEAADPETRRMMQIALESQMLTRSSNLAPS